MNIPQRQLFYNLLNFSLPILFNTLIETNKAIKNIINTELKIIIIFVILNTLTNTTDTATTTNININIPKIVIITLALCFTTVVGFFHSIFGKYKLIIIPNIADTIANTILITKLNIKYFISNFNPI